MSFKKLWEAMASYEPDSWEELCETFYNQGLKDAAEIAETEDVGIDAIVGELIAQKIRKKINE